MDLAFVLWLSISAVLGGVVGSLLGLGGGIVIVPVYTIALGLPVHVAVGTSLVAVVANASSAAAVYLRSHLANLRLALLLATITAAGSLTGGLIGTSVAGPWLLGTFGVLLLGVGGLMLARPESGKDRGAAARGEVGPGLAEANVGAAGGGDSSLEGRFLDPAARAEVGYRPRRVGAGFLFSFLAGNLSGMLGIGGGVVQVPVMNLMLGVPIKAATATSSHIISLTAAAGAVVYLARGFVDPVVTAVTIVGVYLGARAGAELARILPSVLIRRVFSVVLFYMAARMLAEAFGLLFPG